MPICEMNTALLIYGLRSARLPNLCPRTMWFNTEQLSGDIECQVATEANYDLKPKQNRRLCRPLAIFLSSFKKKKKVGFMTLSIALKKKKKNPQENKNDNNKKQTPRLREMK